MFEPGTQLGRYEIQRRLGRGGMGTVYVAHDPVLGRMVAIKVFAGDLEVPDARERFSREARAAAALNHPNIVTVYDFGEYDSQPYIVMEYVPGETMATVIRRKAPVPMGDKLRWMQELCAGAAYAHAMSVVHRDIKPANLMIDRSGRLKILDFGIARLLGIASNTSAMIGTPGYMAPEQITGEPVDHRADQFSIGVVFYELLAYTEPFPGDTLPAVTHRILNEQPAPLASLAPDASPDIITIVEQALQKRAADRFDDTDMMRSAISRVRRRFYSDDSWAGLPTMPFGRDTPAGGNRGTGSSRRRTKDAVGIAQLTPPPDPRRTDREALARRRTAQVEQALTEARGLLASQQLEAALDACQQALTLDETHAGALELESEIGAALRARDGVPANDDPDRTIAPDAPASASGRASRPFESQVVTRVGDAKSPGTDAPPVGEEPPLAGLPPIANEAPSTRPAPETEHVRATGQQPTYTARGYSAKPHDPPSAAPFEPTIVVPGRRTPAPAQQAPQPAAPPAATPPVDRQAPPPPVRARVPVEKKPAGQNLMTAVQASTSSAAHRAAQSLRAINLPALSRIDPRVLWGTVAVVVLAAAAATYLLTRGPAPSGTLFIDATPWGTITAIKTDGGETRPLPPETSTPLSLVVPAGDYQITLTGPPPESRVVTFNVRVDANGIGEAPITRFQTVTPEQYFEQYLGSSTSSQPADAASAPGAAAATEPATGGTP